jgi:hypothetical protein
MIETTQETRLAPANVLQVNGARVTVLLGGAEVEATNAVAFPYAPQEGDVVLVISGEQHYVIGVLQPTGDVQMHFPANLHIHARGGIQFTSGERVEMQAPNVKVTAGKWEVVARTLSEKVVKAMRWVKELSMLKAGRRTVNVEGTNQEHAGRQIIRASKDVRVNGERIHIG